MTGKSAVRWGALVAVNVALWCAVCMFDTGFAQTRGPQMPFANPVAQRDEMIKELRLINAQLTEQNALLRSGQLKVVVVQQK